MKLIIFMCLIALPFSSLSKDYEKLFQELAHTLGNIITENGTNPQCGADLELVLTDITNGEYWALKIIDASSKLNPGILFGNTYHFGNYAECLNLHPLLMENTSVTSQYCTIHIKSKSKKIIKNLGLEELYSYDFVKTTATICMPESCKMTQVQALWQLVQNRYKLPFELIIKDEFCLHKDQNYETYEVDVYVYLFFAVILGLVLLGTCCDFYAYIYETSPNSLVIFSLYSNISKLFTVDDNQDKLTCLYGVRVLSMAWVIVGQLAKIKAVSPNINTMYIISQWIYTLNSSFMFGSYYAIETFFLVTGLLMVYNHMKNLEKTGFSLFNFYYNKLLKVIPAMLVAILAYISLIKAWSDGPLWPDFIKEHSEKCCNTWWATLFFVSNYIPSASRCMEQSWYSSVSMQLCLLTPIIFLCIKNWPTQVIKATTVTILACIFYTWTITIQKNLGCVSYFQEDYDNYILHSITSHAPSFLIGAMCGYLIYQKKQIPSSLILWIISVSTLIGLVYLNNFAFVECQNNSTIAALFNSLAKPLWSLCVAFIIYDCVNHGGYINDFLSNYGFAVLDKLTYCMFLTHLGLIAGVAASKQAGSTFSNFALYFEFWGTTGATLIYSACLYFLTEAPILAYKERCKKPIVVPEKEKQM